MRPPIPPGIPGILKSLIELDVLDLGFEYLEHLAGERMGPGFFFAAGGVLPSASLLALDDGDGRRHRRGLAGGQGVDLRDGDLDGPAGELGQDELEATQVLRVGAETRVE